MVQRLFYKYAIIDCKGDDFYDLDLWIVVWFCINFCLTLSLISIRIEGGWDIAIVLMNIKEFVNLNLMPMI